MSYTEQEKKRALTLYDESRSITMVIQKLGYPSRQNYVYSDQKQK